MSWMTPVRSDTEDLFQPVPVRLDPDQAEAQLGDRVADDVVRLLAADLHQHQRSLGSGSGTRPGESRAEPVPPVEVADLDSEYSGLSGQRRLRLRPEQPATVQDDDVVADVLELAEQMRGDQLGDAELGADPADQREHL